MFTQRTEALKTTLPRLVSPTAPTALRVIFEESVITSLIKIL